MTTPICAYPLPAQSDAANIVTSVTSVASAWDTRGVPRFTTVAERDAAIPVPVTGMLCYVDEYSESYVFKNSLWLSSAPRIIVKSNRTSRATTSFTNDNELRFLVEGSSIYLIENIFTYQSVNTADIKFTWSGPSGCTISATYVDALLTIADGSGSEVYMGAEDDIVATPLAGGGLGMNDQVGMRFKVFLDTASTAGEVITRWAQNTKDTNDPSILWEGCSMEIWKIG